MWLLITISPHTTKNLAPWSGKPMSQSNHKWQTLLAICLWTHFKWITWRHPTYPYPALPHTTQPNTTPYPTDPLTAWCIYLKWTMTIVDVSSANEPRTHGHIFLLIVEKTRNKLPTLQKNKTKATHKSLLDHNLMLVRL